jgi:hypothetical protein
VGPEAELSRVDKITNRLEPITERLSGLKKKNLAAEAESLIAGTR